MKYLVKEFINEKYTKAVNILKDREDVLWEMKKQNLNYKARIVKGEGHFWTYVEKELPYVLTFHSDSFKEA